MAYIMEHGKEISHCQYFFFLKIVTQDHCNIKKYVLLFIYHSFLMYYLHTYHQIVIDLIEF